MDPTSTRISPLPLHDALPISNPQRDLFITEAAGGTMWGCYRQAVMETRTRFYTLRRETIDALILDAEIRETPPVRQDKNSERLKVFKQNLELSEKIEQIQTLVRELSRFYAQADALKDELDTQGYPEKQCEKVYWLKRMMTAAAKDIESNGRVSGETMASLILLGEEGKQVLKDVARNTFPKHLEEMFEPYRLPRFSNKIAAARKKILHELRQLPDSSRVVTRLSAPVDAVLAPASDPQ